MKAIGRLFGGSGFLFASTGIALGARFVAQVAVVRALTVEYYGVFAAGLAVVAIFEGASVARSGEIWLHRMPGLLHSVESWPPTVGKIRSWFWREELSWTMLSFLLLAGASVVYLIFIDFQVGLAILAMGLTMFGLLGFGGWKSFIVLSGNLRALAASEVMGSTLTLLCLVTGATLFGFWGAVWGQVAAALARNLSAAWVTKWILKSQAREQYVISRSEPAKGRHLHSFLGSGIYSLFNNVDLLVLSVTAPAESIAIYKVGKTMANLGGQFFQPLWNAVRPKWLKVYYSGTGISLFKIIALASLTLGMMAMVGLVIISKFGDYIVATLYGAQYGGALRIVLILWVGQIAMQVVTGWSRQWMVARGDFILRNKVLILVLACLPILSYFFDYKSVTDLAMAYVVLQGLWMVIWWTMFINGTLSHKARTNTPAVIAEK